MKIRTNNRMFFPLKRPRRLIRPTERPPSQPLTDNLEEDVKKNAITPSDAVRLERDILGMKSAKLRSLPISDSGGGFQGTRFLPPAPGLRWVQLTSTLPNDVTNPHTGNSLDSAIIQQQRIPRACTLAFAIALPQRDVCEVPWNAWRGKGSMFGVNYATTVLSPSQHSRVKSPVERSKIGKKVGSAPKQEGMLLPVVFSIRHYRYSEILRLPLVGASGASIGRQAIAQFLTHYHMIRHSQPSPSNKIDNNEEGDIDGGEGNFEDMDGRRPPQILHTWEMPSSVDGGSSKYGQQNVLGLDYEASLTDESTPRRHALTLFLDSGTADSVLEVCVSAPAMSWDELWEGDEENTLTHSIGLAGRGGLRTISESFTILNDDGKMQVK